MNFQADAKPRVAPRAIINTRIQNWSVKNLLSFFCFVIFILSSGPTWAQIDTGSISGTVKDPSGAIVPDVHITLINDATAVKQKVDSSSTGGYVFEAVPPGTYTLQAATFGFKRINSRKFRFTCRASSRRISR